MVFSLKDARPELQQKQLQRKPLFKAKFLTSFINKSEIPSHFLLAYRAPM
jgi:hypothetical protein